MTISIPTSVHDTKATEAALNAATGRIYSALIKFTTQPPLPIPPVPIVDVASVWHDALIEARGCAARIRVTRSSLHAFSPYEVGLDVKAGPSPQHNWVTGSVHNTIMKLFYPSEVLALLTAADVLASKWEASASGHLDRVETALVSALLAEEGPAREVAKRVKAERDEAEDRLSWIRDYGSDRLRRHVEHGIECASIYRDERMAAERPNWVLVDNWCAGHDPRTTEIKFDVPRNIKEIEALDMLDAARKDDPDCVLNHYRALCEDAAGATVLKERGYCLTSKFLGRDIVCTVTVPAGEVAK